VPRRRLHRLMKIVSERNYFGVSVPVIDGDTVEEHLFETFVRLRCRYHLHTERVYLLGFGDAGTQALRTALRRPAWFAGVAAISARWPESPQLLAQYDELRGKRVLLGIGEADSAAIVSDALYMQQLLWSAGMHVTALAASAGGDTDHCLLREVDRWIMQGIEQPELVC
jgi:predicted esterase